MGDALRNDQTVLNDGVTIPVANQDSMGPAADTALMPYEPDGRIFWAVESGIQMALGGNTWDSIKAALPDPASFSEMEHFVTGILAGVRDAIADFVTQNIQLLIQGAGLTISFYRLATDLDVWEQIEQFYTDHPGSDPSDFRQFLQTNYPALYTAITALPRLQDRFNALVEAFTSTKEQIPWPPAAYLIAQWVVKLRRVIGAQLQPEVANLVASKGKPQDQGQIIGKVVSYVVIQVVSLASGLFEVLQGVLGAARPILVAIRQSLGDIRVLEGVGVLAAHVAPGIIEAGNDAGQGVKAAVNIYGDLKYKIGSYTAVRKQTSAFHSTVQDILGYALWKEQYVSLRLDVHHIVEQNFLTKNKSLAAQFYQVFGWKSGNDMHCIVLHYELHISGGDTLKQLGSISKENKKSLTTALRDFLKEAQKGPGGTTKPFTNLSSLFQAHADFYAGYSSDLWQKLQPWFAWAMAKIKAAGL
jgi:hypothetical protein